MKHPYYIIEIDCPSQCMNGKGMKPYHDNRVPNPDCPFCKGSGKRQLAVWQPRELFDSIEIGGDLSGNDRRTVILYEDEPYSVYGFIQYYSPYQSNAILPNGERIGKVELRQWKNIGTRFKAISAIPKNFYNESEKVDTWLCTALIKE